jgi:hypothetical protein
MALMLVSPNGDATQFLIGELVYYDTEEKTVALKDCRILRQVMIPTPQGMQMASRVGPLPGVAGPITSLQVGVGTGIVIDLTNDPDREAELRELIRDAEKMEAEMRMHAAGLVSPNVKKPDLRSR